MVEAIVPESTLIRTEENINEAFKQGILIPSKAQCKCGIEFLHIKSNYDLTFCTLNDANRFA